MFRPLVLACALFCASCGPAPTPPVRVWDVSAESVYLAYRDASDRWTGQRVRVVLAAGEYVAAPNSVGWYARRREGPPDVQFHGAAPPQGEPAALAATGTVRGTVRNDGPRGWHVAVTDCTFEPSR